jgi:hypothetical protein
MKPLPCSEVEAQIELFAAGECDEPTSSAIREHLAGCPRCAEAFRSAQQLLGLLDLRFQEDERLERLRQRLAAEQVTVVQSKARILPFLRRAGALAAMLLVAVGLFLWLRPGPSSRTGDKGDGDLVVRKPNDFSQWSRTVLPTSVAVGEAKLTRPAQKVDAVPETVVWAAPGTNWQIRSSRRIDLTAGKLFVRAPPVRRPEGTVFQVHTAAGVVETGGAGFFIQLQEARAAAGRLEKKGGTKPVVSVIVVSGRVQLSNSIGKATGTKGTLLRAAEQERPKRTLDRERAPIPP